MVRTLRLKEDLELARRMRLKLPESLLKRIQRLKHHSVLERQVNHRELKAPQKVLGLGFWRLTYEEEVMSGVPNLLARLRELELDEELPRQLSEVREAVLGVRAEQQAMRRVQEEELVELCKVRSLLEREEKMERERLERQEKEKRERLEKEEKAERERLEKERERERERLERERELRVEKERELERQREERERLQEERLQMERLQWEERERLRQERDEERERDKEELRRALRALEERKKQDAVRIQQLEFLQDARREESLQAELRQLEQEEKEVQRRRLELQMQASPPLEPVVQCEQHALYAPRPQESGQNPHEAGHLKLTNRRYELQAISSSTWISAHVALRRRN